MLTVSSQVLWHTLESCIVEPQTLEHPMLGSPNHTKPQTSRSKPLDTL